MRALIWLGVVIVLPMAWAEPLSSEQQVEVDQTIESLEEPLYTPFIERYVLDELKQLRQDQANIKHELMQQILDREHSSVDRGVTYATDTITYFFYLLAAASSLLVFIGWSSFRDIKNRVHTLADEQVSTLVAEYEKRLAALEKQLQQKSVFIEENREEIEKTREIQSLWLRAQQEASINTKIALYDEILKLKYFDAEALSYKADAVLELDEPKWAANLCHQALKIDPEHSHALYQLACAYTAMGQFDEATEYLKEAVSKNGNYLNELHEDEAFEALKGHPAFEAIVSESSVPDGDK